MVLTSGKSMLGSKPVQYYFKRVGDVYGVGVKYQNPDPWVDTLGLYWVHNPFSTISKGQNVRT